MDLKNAHEYIVDPLMGPDPSEETGLNATHRISVDGKAQPRRSSGETSTAPRSNRSSQLGSNNPFRSSVDGGSVASSSAAAAAAANKNRTRVSARPVSVSGGYPTPPHSASPSRSTFASSHRQEAFGGHSDSGKGSVQTRTRASSLGERYPGDMSHKPLDLIRKDSRRAHRSPHLRRHHQPGADTIDRLDRVGPGVYHHEGPYDAALLARNTSYTSSPVAAVSGTNQEALRATPRENVVDSLERHRPLDGVASIPPGQEDRFGRRYDYQEGSNMMIDNDPPGGAYKRWPGLDYHPDDIKGKSEPAYSIDRALKEHKARGQDVELQDRSTSATATATGTGRQSLDDGASPRRSLSVGRSVGAGLKKRIGSLRRKDRE